MPRFLTTALTLVLGFSNCLGASPEKYTDDAETAARLDQVAQKYHDLGMFDGVVLIARDGKVLLENAYGHADRELGVPNEVGGVFSLGSLTKQFTAAVVMRLVERGKLSLDEPVRSYLPDLREDLGESITLHHLLTHGAGFVNQIRQLTDQPDSTRFLRQDMLDIINSAELRWTPGEDYGYSNVGYVLAALICEEVTGKEMSDLVIEELFAPLGMTDSAVVNQTILKPGRAKPHYLLNTGEVVRPNYMHMSYALGSGQMESTVADLLKWDQALYGDELLSAESRRKMFTPYDGEASGNYGFGWRIIEYERATWSDAAGSQGTLIRHGGSLPGYVCNMHRYVDDRVTVIALSNLANCPIMNITTKLAEVALGREVKLSTGSITFNFWRIVRDQGVPAGVAWFEKTLATDAPQLDNQDLHRMGHELRRYGFLDEALKVFEVNRAVHPTKPRAYTNIGRALFEAGRFEQAKAVFLKALELSGDAGNDRAESYLKEIEVVTR